MKLTHQPTLFLVLYISFCVVSRLEASENPLAGQDHQEANLVGLPSFVEGGYHGGGSEDQDDMLTLVCSENPLKCAEKRADDTGKETLKSLRELAWQGFPGAMYNLSTTLIELRGSEFWCDATDREAVSLLRQLAQLDFILAKYHLSLMLLEGRGSDDSGNARYQEALKWLNQIIHTDIKDIKANLALTRSLGGIVRVKNIEYPEVLCAFATELHNEAKRKLYLTLAEGRGVGGPKMPEDKAIVEYISSLAYEGDVEAMCKLAMMRLNGQGELRDDVEAIYWFIRGGAQQPLKNFFVRNAEAPMVDSSHKTPSSHTNSYMELSSNLREVIKRFSKLAEAPNAHERSHEETKLSELNEKRGFRDFYIYVSKLANKVKWFLEDLNNPGILVNIIKRKSDEILVAPLKRYIPSYDEHCLTVGNIPYQLISYGKDNVRNAREILGFISRTDPLWLEVSTLLEPIKETYQNKLRIILEDHNTSIKKSKIFEKAPLTEMGIQLCEGYSNDEENVCLEMTKISKTKKIMESKIEDIEFVQRLPENIAAVLVSHLGQRNASFRAEHPWIDALDHQ